MNSNKKKSIDTQELVKEMEYSLQKKDESHRLIIQACVSGIECRVQFTKLDISHELISCTCS